MNSVVNNSQKMMKLSGVHIGNIKLSTEEANLNKIDTQPIGVKSLEKVNLLKSPSPSIKKEERSDQMSLNKR
jgi:hypothetical protein